METLSRAEQAAQNILANAGLVVVDVGAAVFLPANFNVLERIATLCLFEPNPQEAESLRAGYLRREMTNVTVFAEALAGSNGPRTLHVTNAPTGSSLLKPGGRVAEEFVEPDYFYPIREVTVQTRALADVLKEASLPRADALKIDVQGAEVEVMQGLGQNLVETLSVELEIGFPGAYLDQKDFAQTDAFLTAAGFTLFDLRISRQHRQTPSDIAALGAELKAGHGALSGRITEADAIYFRRTDLVLAAGEAAPVRRLAVLFCAYGFFLDALALLLAARDKGLLTTNEFTEAKFELRAWHHAGRDAILDTDFFVWASRFLTRVSRFAQRRLLGRRFWRWTN